MSTRYSITSEAGRDLGSVEKEGDEYAVRAYGRNTTYVRGLPEDDVTRLVLTYVVSHELNIRVTLTPVD